MFMYKMVILIYFTFLTVIREVTLVKHVMWDAGVTYFVKSLTFISPYVWEYSDSILWFKVPCQIYFIINKVYLKFLQKF